MKKRAIEKDKEKFQHKKERQFNAEKRSKLGFKNKKNKEREDNLNEEYDFYERYYR